eukprot:TRINITY_DN2968_c0_g1_i2.p1 TRINITY_DN2968_c0_g1~~TRINITY_DN2968_c0_g1_i2.p1  ORF type:complete len:121 (-),score=2.40 TRINITY_DN2968_c0_g1_i2:207-569(-)
MIINTISISVGLNNGPQTRDIDGGGDIDDGGIDQSAADAVVELEVTAIGIGVLERHIERGTEGRGDGGEGSEVVGSLCGTSGGGDQSTRRVGRRQSKDGLAAFAGDQRTINGASAQQKRR